MVHGVFFSPLPIFSFFLNEIYVILFFFRGIFCIIMSRIFVFVFLLFWQDNKNIFVQSTKFGTYFLLNIKIIVFFLFFFSFFGMMRRNYIFKNLMKKKKNYT
jgi:hypothetical protein